MGSKSGTRYPVRALGLHGWTGNKWIEIVTSSGSLAVGINEWGGTELTGRDITTDIQSLADDSIIGVLRSIGDAGATPTNATGKTILQLIEELSRTLEDAGATPTAASTTKTIRRLLEDILGGTGTANRADSKTGAAPDTTFSAEVTFDTSVNKVEAWAFDNDAEIVLVATDGTESDPMTVPKNGYRDWVFDAKGFKIRNKVAGSVANYEVTGLWTA